jgi:hypothetical protein
MALTEVNWQIIISTLGVSTQLLIAYLSRRQTAKQLDIQQLASHRSTASFVADKRQKWIDELRTDMAFHLALSQEVVWKWDAMRSAAIRKIEEEAKNDSLKAKKILQDAADTFSPENGARDRDHQERHIRIKFRLNPEEDLHIKLRTCLDEIRDVLNSTQGTQSKSEANALIEKTMLLVEQAVRLTEKVLKAEWRRVKQEVAYPEALMESIPKPEKK